MKINLPVLTAFVDGLKPDSIQHMPFLSSLQYQRRLRTDLGYSVTCHATMYSGVYPQKHKIWFLWQYSPETSPFRWLPESRILDTIDSLPSRYAFGKMTTLFQQNTSYAGISVMKKSRLHNWKYFDVTEKKFWDEPGYIPGFPTIFDILREKRMDWKSVGFVNGAHKGGDLSYIKSFTIPSNLPAWTYLFIGEIDHVSHFYTQESEEARRALLDVDREIERIYTEMKKRIGQEPIFFCFSDHGHMKVERKYDIYEHFLSRGFDLDNFIHIVDTNFARFWFRNSQEEKLIYEIMNDLDLGFFLTTKEFKRFNTLMPDNRYGDAIYYLDAPNMFKRTVWGYGTRTISIHGYLPDYMEKDGVFISNQSISKQGHIELVDILPSTLTLLGIKIEREFDGKPIW